MAAATRLIAGTSGSPASIISAKFTPSHAQVYRNDEEEREDSTLLDNLNNSSSGSSTARWHSIDRASERHSRKKLWLGCVALILAAAAAALALESYQNGTTRLNNLFSETSRHCQDPYAMPGYLLHNNKAGTARWIPYTDAILTSNATPAVLPSNRNDAYVEKEILTLAPPSFATKLKNRKSAGTTQNDDEDLDFLRGKTVLLLGCSLDRFFMESFCRLHGATMVNVRDDWHGMFKCTVPGVDLQLQLWFTYGALPSRKALQIQGDIKNFEDRIKEYWIPEATKHNLTITPDLIIWSSGTWDVLGLRQKYCSHTQSWMEQAVSWQELTWHRQRMHQMISFIRTQWPDTPALYRPPTYTYKKGIPSSNEFLDGVKLEDIDQINEGLWRLQQSADAVLKAEDMPAFRWAEKLVGNNQYSDTMHFRGDSYAQWLYAEMMLYYLHHYSKRNPSHCLAGPGYHEN